MFYFLREFINETNCSGVIADVYRASDLKKLDLKQYKFIVFVFLKGEQHALEVYADIENTKLQQRIRQQRIIENLFIINPQPFFGRYRGGFTHPLLAFNHKSLLKSVKVLQPSVFFV